MHCREAFIAIADHEQDGSLPYFIHTKEGIDADSHARNCRCKVCFRTVRRIESAGVGQLRVIHGTHAA